MILIWLQIKYYTEAHKTYSELCRQVDGGTDDELNRSIRQKMTEIRALSITTTDDQP